MSDRIALLSELEMADICRRLAERISRRRLRGREMPANVEELGLMLGEAWTLGIQVGVIRLFQERHCRVCGCTESNACDPPCSWVAQDLCSTCEAVGS